VRTCCRLALSTFVVLAPAAVFAQQTATPPPAQTPPAAAQAQEPQPPPPFVPAPVNIFDFGLRGTSVNGDAARYQRYRDLRSGPFLDDVRIRREKKDWLFDMAGQHVGWRDQRYVGAITRPGVLKAWGFWDQIPMHMSETTSTLFVEKIADVPPVLTIPDAQQAIVQTNVATLPAVLDANGITFDTESFRHIAQGGVEYLPAADVTVRAVLQVTNRKGVLPYGGSFGHSSLVEIPAPIDHRTTDLQTSGEVNHGRLLLRGTFGGSWFHNANTEATFDSPFRITDLAGTPSHGRVSLAPDNAFLTVNGMASLKLPGRSRATAYVSVGSLTDAGAPIMPQTINTAIAAQILPLPRQTVNGEARTGSINLSFVSHPVAWMDIDARYRTYDYDNRTPVFVMPQRVAYDNTPAAPTFTTLGGATSPLVVETEPFGVNRESFDATLRAHLGRGTAGIGYSRLNEERVHRFFESTRENLVRLSYDLIGAARVTVRTKYEHGEKRGDVTEESRRELFNIGEQPDMRQFDIASRDRNRVTVLASVAPVGAFSFNGSIAAGKDDYVASSFGLRDNMHRIYSGAAEWLPNELVNIGVSYSYERYDALQRSRQANPPAANAAVTYEQFLQLSAQPSSSVQVADATRNWGSEGADRAHSVIAHVDVTGLREKWDVRLNYDFNHMRSLYTYSTGPDVPRTLPEEVPPPVSTLPDPSQLPLIRSDLGTGTADVLYAFTSRLSVGASYLHERYRVADFTLDSDANKEQARGPVLLLGYMYRPYTANTVWARLVYKW